MTAPTFAYTSSLNPYPYEITTANPGSRINAPMIDATGNMWIGSEDQLNEVTSSGSYPYGNGAPNYNTSFTQIYGGSAGLWEGGVERFSAMDGDGKIVVDAASGNFGFVSVYYPNAPSDGLSGTQGGADVYLNPCYVASGTTTCATNNDGGSLIVNASRGSAVDASGAIWASLSSGDNMIQLLGPGAPNWSQASYIPKVLQTNSSRRPY